MGRVDTCVFLNLAPTTSLLMRSLMAHACLADCRGSVDVPSLSAHFTPLHARPAAASALAVAFSACSFPRPVQPSRSAVESRRRPRRLGRWSIHHSNRYAPPAVARRLHAPRASPFPVMISALGITVRAHKLCGDFAGTSLRKLAPSAPQSRGRWPPR